MVWSVLILKPYLDGSHFKIQTNRQALRWTPDLKESAGRLARWRISLLEFDFEVVHRPGVFHQAADAMSCLPKEKFIAETLVEDEIPTLNIQRNDKDNLPVVCVVIHVEMPIPSKTEL